jgi:hypothetical protein
MDGPLRRCEVRDPPANKRARGNAEQLLRSPVCGDVAPVIVGDHDRIRRLGQREARKGGKLDDGALAGSSLRGSEICMKPWRAEPIQRRGQHRPHAPASRPFETAPVPLSEGLRALM